MSIWIIVTCCDRWNITCNVKMLNVINNKLKSIKHIENNFCMVLILSWHVIFIKHSSWKIYGSFKIWMIMLMHLAQNYGKHMHNVMNEIKLCDNLIYYSYKLLP
jgi:hypothetical protein